MMPSITDVARGDGWELRLGNCLRDEWPECDHVFTDTPYCDHVHAHHRTSKVGHGRTNVTLDFPPFDPFDRAVTAIKIAQVVSRWVLLFSDHESVSQWIEAVEFASLRKMRVGTWHKPGSTPQLTGDRPGQATEAVVIAHAQQRSRWNGGGLPAFWSYPTRDGCTRVHQTQKPLPLLERMVEQFTDPGELIIDPFAGSATSGVAAIRCGRRWVGWERDPDMFAVAKRRLEATHEQPQLPFEPRAKAQQGRLPL